MGRGGDARGPGQRSTVIGDGLEVYKGGSCERGWRGLGWGGDKERRKKGKYSYRYRDRGRGRRRDLRPDLHPSGWLAGSCTVRSASSVRVQPGSAHGSIAEEGRRGAAPQGIMSWMKRNVASKMKTPTPTPRDELDEQEPRAKSQEPRAHAAEPRTRSNK